MSILVGRTKRRRRAASPSVREVCLVGIAPPAPAAWAPEGRVTLSGRVYRVAATQGRPDAPAAQGGPPRYIHLAAESGG